LSNLLNRLSIASCRKTIESHNDEEKFYLYLYGDCSLSPRAGITSETLEVMRNDILYSLARSSVDLFSAIFGKRGGLAVSAVKKEEPGEGEEVVISSSSNKSNKSNKTTSSVLAKKINEVSDATDSAEQIEESLKKIRLEMLESLLFSPVNGCCLFDAVTGCITSLLAIQDAYTCKKALKVRCCLYYYYV
jgi:hypothetical protein